MEPETVLNGPPLRRSMIAFYWWTSKPGTYAPAIRCAGGGSMLARTATT
jgi:hypothetical protein